MVLELTEVEAVQGGRRSRRGACSVTSLHFAKRFSLTAEC